MNITQSVITQRLNSFVRGMSLTLEGFKEARQ